MSMIKTLTAVGNSLGLIIDKPILELLGIDKDTRLEVRTDGEGLIIRPVREDRQDRGPAIAAGGAPPPPSTALPAAGAGLDDELDDEILKDMAALDDKPAARPPPPPAAKAPPPPPPSPPSTLRPATSAGTPSAKSRVENGAGSTPPSSSSGPSPAPAKKGAVPEVVVEQKGEEVLRIPMTGQELVIGREHTADVHLDDRALSRKHAKVEKRGAALWVSDLGSANGTYVNGEKATEPRPLLAGDVIGVGHYKVRVEGVEQAGEKTPVLTLTGPEGTHRFALVGDQIVIGRSQSCDISIGHKSISRRHVRITKEPDGFQVHDLGSQNGCKLNGKPLTGSAPFGVGDRLDICDFSLSLGFLDEEGAAPQNGEKPRRPATMLIDKSAMAQAAYVDGDFENVRSRLAPKEGASQAGPAKADTGEYAVAEVEKKKPKVVRPKARR
jgi:pSer/pThr/pTyr-binding forkhead associated (FHA) protein/antitoxin component of MazEF toxin-antitoxin module